MFASSLLTFDQLANRCGQERGRLAYSLGQYSGGDIQYAYAVQ